MNVVANGDATGLHVGLGEAAQQGDVLILLQLLATALADNLHVDASAFEAYILVEGSVGGLTLRLEGGFVNDLDAIGIDEVVDGILLLLLHVGIGLIVLAACRQKQHGEQQYGINGCSHLYVVCLILTAKVQNNYELCIMNDDFPVNY